MPLNLDEVSMRCMGCNTSQTLETAVRQGWKMCRLCNFAICGFCYENLDPAQHCLSFECTPRHRKLDPIPLPIEKILIFAQEHAYEQDQKGLLYKIFYQDQELTNAPPFFVVREKERAQPSLEDKPTKVQEEVWSNFRLVITKRRGGKFITWEKII